MFTIITLRPYQENAKNAVLHEWDTGNKNTLLVLPTGCGKTIVFSEIAKERVRKGKVLVLAHRGELLDQAADKIRRTIGIECAYEKAEQSALESDLPITVGSVQSLARENRLNKYSPDHYATIIIDEAHHCLADTYERVLEHFGNANVLGVTATPDRGDKKALSKVFDSQAYEYSLKQAIEEKYLCPIWAKLVPLQLDISKVSVSSGDFNVGDLDDALLPYMEQIADEIAKNYRDRKIVIFLPLIRTSQRMRDLLVGKGISAAEVNGNSADRKEILQDFEDNKYTVICNSMLLTEGWDCPSVDCVIVLRPTKIRSLYSQMVGRGTRLFPGKKELLLLDFLWMSERHNLCHPSALVATNETEAAMTDQKVNSAAEGVDILSAYDSAMMTLTELRERVLAANLRKMRNRKEKLVDPLQYYASIQALNLINYSPIFRWEKDAPTEKQLDTIEKFGVDASIIKTKGEAKAALDQLVGRVKKNMSSPKQIRLLERYGFMHVGTWNFEEASDMITKISNNNWKVPLNVEPSMYKPKR